MKIWLIILLAVIWLPEATAQVPKDSLALDSLNRDELAEEVNSSEPGESKKDGIWGNSFFVVPIPVSNPTLGTGLVVGAAYFYPQTQAQEKVQPASVTGAGGFYTDNESRAIGVGHQSYWGGDKWRLGAVAGFIDLNLDLLNPVSGMSESEIDWLLEGSLFVGKLSRRLRGDWYAGLLVRWLDIDQEFDIDVPPGYFETGANSQVTSIGLQAEHDSRDKPINSYEGRLFQIDAMETQAKTGARTQNYQSYSTEYRSFHALRDDLVLAWEVQACHRSDGTPLWDSCLVDLRGFNITNFLSRTTASAQVEARWRLRGRWGAVAFAGSGLYDRSFIGDDDLVPSVGVGIRWMVLESQRVNIRVDFAWSDDDSAVYLAVGEAF